MTTIGQLAGITSQHNEIVKRVGNGSLDPIAVRRALQDIIEGKLSATLNWNPPSWWRAPGEQLARARQRWPNAVLPQPPVNFEPQTTTEVLLLHVPGSFDDLWVNVVAPTGCAKRRWAGFGAKYLRFSPNKRVYAKPVWLGFDPEHGRGRRCSQLWGQPNLAAGEVLSALTQFPDWSLSWFEGASAPFLSGYQYEYKLEWTSVPHIMRVNGFLELTAYIGDSDSYRWASPSVREC